MKVLICNVGSTSLKFKLYEMPEETVFVEAKVERVGSKENAIYEYRNLRDSQDLRKEGKSVPHYSDGINMFLTSLLDPSFGVLGSIDEIGVIGFKTVLAKDFYGIHELTNEVLEGMEEYLFVAPAHNGPYLEAIRMFRNLLPNIMLIGAFETAFHKTIPLERRLYSLPYSWYKKYGIMRMGYHGASHSYIAKTLTEQEGTTGKLICCHLGGSSSVCAVLNGESVDNSFGFSLQTGIPHACRSGDIDSYIVPFLMNNGMELEDIIYGISKNGGMLGLSGVDKDMREILLAAENGNRQAEIAIEVFVCSVVRYIGSYYAELGGLDHLIFTGGIGENSPEIRERICKGLKHMGIILNTELNRTVQGPAVLSCDDSSVKIQVILANEEIDIARKSYKSLLDKNPE